MGSKAQIMAMGAVSQWLGKAFSVRHQIVSPGQELSIGQLRKIIDNYAKEFNLSADVRRRICVVRHKKPRDDGKPGSEYHYHIAIPEVDTQTGLVVKNGFTALRNEKLSRLAELQFGHDIVPGAMNKAVYKNLTENHPEIDLGRFQLALEEAAVEACMKREDWLEYRAEAGFSSKEYQILNRKLEQAEARDGVDFKKDIDIKKIRKDLQALARSSDGISAFLVAIENQGFDIQPGKKAGIHRVWKGGFEIGSLDRLSRLPRTELHEAILEHKSLGGRSHDSTGNKSAEKTGLKTSKIYADGIGGGSLGDSGDVLGPGLGEIEGLNRALEYATNRGRRRPDRCPLRRPDPGGVGGKTTAAAADAAKRSDFKSPEKLRLSAARIRANFFRARDRVHAQRLHSTHMDLTDASSSDGGGEVFDAGDFFMLSRWAADYRRKNKISGP